jgi:hypothetical protein
MLHKLSNSLVRARGRVVAAAVFAVCFALGYNRGGAPTVSARDSDGRCHQHRRRARHRLCRLVHLPVVQSRGLEDAVRTIRARVQRSAEAESRRFVSVGSRQGRGHTSGMEHLAKFGRFDEVMAGLGWANIGLLNYCLRSVQGAGRDHRS